MTPVEKLEHLERIEKLCENVQEKDREQIIKLLVLLYEIGEIASRQNTAKFAVGGIVGQPFEPGHIVGVKP